MGGVAQVITLCRAPYFGNSTLTPMTFSNHKIKSENWRHNKKKIEEKYFKMELFWDFQCID